ncbi:MAG: EAL domain-containing protein, partial [Ruminococcaceae bacterium]|nr:EAL domain-containing protein [Oscillospiraceae bacterium]
MKRRVLVVDDNEINRAILIEMLRGEYNITEAEDGEEALEILKNEGKKISAVLLDIIMPKLDGFEVLRCMQGDPQLERIPVLVTTGSAESDSEVKALSLGASDFITKPYNTEVLKHRLWNLIHLRESADKIEASRIDELTGLYNRKSFLEEAAKMVAKKEAGYYVMSCFDIESFKIINDQYGTKTGDEVLKYIADTINRAIVSFGGVCCRVASDNFAMLYPCSFIGSKELEKNHRDTTTPPGIDHPIVVRIGRYIVNDLSLSVNAMYDRASMAEMSIRGRYDKHIAQYDETMRESLIREQQIVNEMYDALKDGQFEPWFQPQYNHASGALIGAEILVRWRRPNTGLLVPPNDFIPVFERNGFIYEMDKYIWESACLLIRKWIVEGNEPIPVSVNISRVDLFREDFFETITGFVKKYDVPVDLLRLEITESAFANSAKKLISVVNELIEYGFTVEIDDFGSGYSSLNILKDVPATVLKLDMKLLESSHDSKRAGSILESVVRMAKWLGMSVIAEGVETLDQADYLKSIGCYNIQG